jgi:hypothetical protein
MSDNDQPLADFWRMFIDSLDFGDELGHEPGHEPAHGLSLAADDDGVDDDIEIQPLDLEDIKEVARILVRDFISKGDGDLSTHLPPLERDVIAAVTAAVAPAAASWLRINLTDMRSTGRFLIMLERIIRVVMLTYDQVLNSLNPGDYYDDDGGDLPSGDLPPGADDIPF